MLVLTRKKNQSVNIGDDIVVKVAEIGPGWVRLGIDAPEDVLVLRSELENNDGNIAPLGDGVQEYRQRKNENIG